MRLHQENQTGDEMSNFEPTDKTQNKGNAMTDENAQTETAAVESKRTRELNPVTVAFVTPDGGKLCPIGTHESQADANRWIKENADEGVTYAVYREMGKRVKLKIETIRTFEEV
jgi:hypothetical protein